MKLAVIIPCFNEEKTLPQVSRTTKYREFDLSYTILYMSNITRFDKRLSQIYNEI